MEAPTTEYTQRRAKASALRRRLEHLADVARHEEELASRLRELRVMRTRLDRERAAVEKALAKTRARLDTAERLALEGLAGAVETDARTNQERRRTAAEMRRRKVAEKRLVTLLNLRPIQSVAD